jgi:hypothetical protein
LSACIHPTCPLPPLTGRDDRPGCEGQSAARIGSMPIRE